MSIKIEFQSTPLCEGRPGKDGAPIQYEDFNPRPFARGDLKTIRPFLTSFYFNPRPFARGDYCSRRFVLHIYNFNPRPFARGDSHNSICSL